MRRDLRIAHVDRFAGLLALTLLLCTPRPASAGFFDFLFNGFKNQNSQEQKASTDSAPASGGRYASYCVRTCDGKYFPLTGRAGMTPAQVCQSFCPASTTRVYSGSSIDNAIATNGEHYADLPTAFAYRKALSADCTCTGHGPGGLAPIDISLDTTLRPGDIIMTSNGPVLYSGASGQAAQSSPSTGALASHAELSGDEDVTGSIAPPSAPQAPAAITPPKPKRAVEATPGWHFSWPTPAHR